jgi:D-inositol-3-phosphate glycosyltransferase
MAWTKKLFFKSLILLYQQHMQIGIRKRDFIHTLRFKSINYWICPLNYLRVEVLERTRFAVDKIKVIPIGVELQKFVSTKISREEAR